MHDDAVVTSRVATVRTPVPWPDPAVVPAVQTWTREPAAPRAAHPRSTLYCRVRGPAGGRGKGREPRGAHSEENQR